MKYKLVCFDVDGTLVDNIEFSWQLFHDYFHTDTKKREKAREDFFNGKIKYIEWAEHDIQLWIEKKARKKDFLSAMKESDIRLMAGAKETLGELRNKGYKLAIISGSINIILEYLLPEYQSIFDDIFLSRLYFGKEGNITKVQATEYDMDGKAKALKNIAKREKIKLSECVFIGDHHNDVKIAREAGLSIAFNPKDEELKKAADTVINKKDLREILKYIR
ncbi:HAD-IB family phosphatase [Candidatus Woesearchaeota archaeon]|nr:HAD-IB family phosphatase [Candidatus Woesearchaeota archaeon]